MNSKQRKARTAEVKRHQKAATKKRNSPLALAWRSAQAMDNIISLEEEAFDEKLHRVPQRRTHFMPQELRGPLCSTTPTPCPACEAGIPRRPL